MKRNMTLFSFALLACLMLSGCSKTGGADNPTPFESKEMGFSVTFPDKYSEQDLVSNGIKCTLMMVDGGDKGWTLAYIPLPEDKKASPELLDKITSELTKQMFQKVDKTSDISAGGAIGKELIGEGKDGVEATIRVYLAEGSEYQLIAIGDDAATNKAFFDSFKLATGDEEQKEDSGNDADTTDESTTESE